MVTTNTRAELEIQFDKAGKLYKPHETITGTISLINADKCVEHGEITLIGEGYFDTVSTFQKLTPLPRNARIMFFSKKQIIAKGGKFFPGGAPYKFSFVLEQTMEHPLVDSYEGIEFSIVYKVEVEMPQAGNKLGGKSITGSNQFHVQCPNAGIDPAKGRRQIPLDFSMNSEEI